MSVVVRYGEGYPWEVEGTEVAVISNHHNQTLSMYDQDSISLRDLYLGDPLCLDVTFDSKKDKEIDLVDVFDKARRFYQANFVKMQASGGKRRVRMLNFMNGVFDLVSPGFLAYFAFTVINFVQMWYKYERMDRLSDQNAVQ